MHRDAARVQFIAEMAHGGEKYGDARSVRPDVFGFAADLGHPGGILLRIEAIKRRRIDIELVAEDEDEVSHANNSRSVCCR
jgi:hypothetical protein